MLTRFQHTSVSRQVVFRPVVVRVRVSLLGEIIGAAIAVIFGSMLAEWFVVTFLPALAKAAEYPAAPPVLLSLIVMIASALVAYLFWGLVAFVNARVHPFIQELLEPPRH